SERKLVINATEAVVVQTLFERFLVCRSVDRLVTEAAAMDLRTKARVTIKGRTGGGPFSRGTLYHLLENRSYVGEVVHRDQSFAGQHEAIVSRDLFDRVQAVIAANRRIRKTGGNSPHPSLLAGLLQDCSGQSFTPTHTQKGGRRYQYYVMRAKGRDQAFRLPADEIETVVRHAMSDLFTAPDRMLALAGATDLEAANHTLAAAEHHREIWQGSDPVVLREAAVTFLAGVIHRPDRVELLLKAGALGGEADSTISIEVPTSIVRRGAALKLVIDNAAPRQDPKLLSMIATGEAWFNALVTGEVASISALAARESCTSAYVIRLIEAGFLSPRLKAAIQRGTHPPALTIAALAAAGPLPLDWSGHQAFVVRR
ncbi:MAG: recombinase family protein, partial [bacterium]|nr:recombinase family protein [bacterium]